MAFIIKNNEHKASIVARSNNNKRHRTGVTLIPFLSTGEISRKHNNH